MTLRIDPEVWDKVKAAAAEVDKSTSEWVRDACVSSLSRRTLNASPPVQSAPVRPQRPQTSPGRAKPSVRQSAPVKDAEARLAEVRREPCRHPSNRRIGDGCGMCGEIVKGAK